MVSGFLCSQAIEAHRVSATLPRMPRGALQGGLCRIGRRMIIVGHARCQVIEGSEIEYRKASPRRRHAARWRPRWCLRHEGAGRPSCPVTMTADWLTRGGLA